MYRPKRFIITKNAVHNRSSESEKRTRTAEFYGVTFACPRQITHKKLYSLPAIDPSPDQSAKFLGSAIPSQNSCLETIVDNIF